MLCKCCNPLHSPPKCKAHCKQKQCTHHPFLPFECIPSVAARFPCFPSDGCRTECPFTEQRGICARVSGFAGKPHGFRVQQVRCPHFRQSPPLLPHRTAAHPVLVTSRLASAQILSSSAALKRCLDRTHLAEHQFAEKLAVIIARCNRVCFW